MAQGNNPVCLRQCDGNTGQLVFSHSDIVESCITSRCGVLKSIAEAGGEASLPHCVTMTDFKAWINATTDTAATFQDMSFRDKCTIIKVADVLDDYHMDALVLLAVDHLLGRAQSSDPGSCASSITQGLSILPDHLQELILAEAAANSTGMENLLRFLPTNLHTAVLASTIPSSKLLRIHLSQHSTRFLEALAALPASPPPVKIMHVCDSNQHHLQQLQALEGDRFTPMLSVWQDMASPFIHALHTHTGLLELNLSVPSRDAQTAQELLRAIATLTSLQCLHLGGRHEQAQGGANYIPASCPSIQETLQSLPHLEHLALWLADAPATLKRQRDGNTSAQPNGCLATALSPATALTSLHVILQYNSKSFSSTASFSLPRLSQMTAIFPDSFHLTTSFICHLTAPLTTLELGFDYGLYSCIFSSLPDSSTTDADTFLSSLAKFTHVRRLAAALPADDPYIRREPDAVAVPAPGTTELQPIVPEVRGDATSVFDAMLCDAPAAIASLPRLRDVSIAGEIPVLHRVVGHLASQAAALTRVELRCYRSTAAGDRETTEAWAECFASLSQFSLHELNVCMISDPDLAPGLAALSELTDITALRLSGWPCVDTADDCAALARMTGMRSLCLDSIEDGEPSGSLYQAVRALSALTSLVLRVDDDQLGSELAEHLPREALPALQEVLVAMWHPYPGVQHFVRWAAAMPAVRKATVELHGGGFYGVSSSWREELHRIADEADMELVMHEV